MCLRSLGAFGCALVFLLGACNSREEPASREAIPDTGKSATAEGKPRAEGKKAGLPGAEKRQGGGKQTGAANRKPVGADDGGGTEGSDGGSFAAVWPAAGDYVYGQSGFEEFCQATCDRKDLPEEQPISFSIKDRSENKGVVVSEARTSDSRKVRTTTAFTREHALITEVHTSFKYESFEFQDTYHPDPPVESLRFPLETGMSWSGKWKDKTSGEYTIAVTGRDRVNAGGDSVQAFRIETHTRFKGQFDGRSNVTVWVDPVKRMVVKTTGDIDVKSSFGRYRSEFSTRLRSGPGY